MKELIWLREEPKSRPCFSFFSFFLFYHVLCVNQLLEQRLRAALAMVKKEPHPQFFSNPAPGKKPSTQVALV